MNYRHAFHAGNFADLVKHAALTLLLDALGKGPPLTVIDTHAGAGAYDLAGGMAVRSGEAAVETLLADPDAPEGFDMLVAAVVRANPLGGARVYPGSPALVCAALRPDDSFIACELRDDDFGQLAGLLAPLTPQAQALKADGFAIGPSRVPARGPALVLIDPPYERADDYQRAADCLGTVLRKNRGACVAVWTPLKDLETFDGFLRRIEDLGLPPMLVAETRLRPLSDPTRLNGCALVIAGAPDGVEPQIEQACRWAARRLGDPGNEARLWRI